MKGKILTADVNVPAEELAPGPWGYRVHVIDNRLLLHVDDPAARAFDEAEAVNARWATRELKRQINSLLFERLALGRDKAGVIAPAHKGHEITRPSHLVKDPMVLEFTGLRQDERFRESDREQALIGKLQLFLLELGKRFAFMGRRQRITLDGEHVFIDLVSYNRLTRAVGRGGPPTLGRPVRRGPTRPDVRRRKTLRPRADRDRVTPAHRENEPEAANRPVVDLPQHLNPTLHFRTGLLKFDRSRCACATTEESAAGDPLSLGTPSDAGLWRLRPVNPVWNSGSAAKAERSGEPCPCRARLRDRSGSRRVSPSLSGS